jgi:predicted DNA-binding transcriptional regulator
VANWSVSTLISEIIFSAFLLIIYKGMRIHELAVKLEMLELLVPQYSQ